MLLVMVAAAGLRFWQLDRLPPGLYRDEASNGLDALDVLHGDREGEPLLYFTANNGREPAYIYLTTTAIALLGRTAFAVRLAAAVSGTLTTWLTYKLILNWFDRRSALLAAWMWAVTFWPVHLSRIGLRPILLPMVLALCFWLGTLAYRRQWGREKTAPNYDWATIGLWLSSGIAYGSAFYTYVAVRFTPILLALLVVYLIATGRWNRIRTGLVLFTAGTLAMVAPLGILAWQQPDLIFGRMSQVSLLKEEIQNGSLVGELLRNTAKALGSFVVQGDRIFRHNLPGRAVFDIFMAGPFIIGLVWCFRNWRQPVATTLLLWSGVMLGPTILAEDSPHFLRAVGILPAALIFPALGLSWLWSWNKLPSRFRQGLVLLIVAASLVMTIRDYFWRYADQPQTAYWFEAAARELADNVNKEAEDSVVYVDRRFPDSWPSIPFLIEPQQEPSYYRPEQFEDNKLTPPTAVYAWPYENLSAVADTLLESARQENELLSERSSLALISGIRGGLAQGDFESEPYPLYIRYSLETAPAGPDLANFADTVALRDAEILIMNERQLVVDLVWQAPATIDDSFVVFVHVVGHEGVVGQSDNIPGQGSLPTTRWPVNVLVRDHHEVTLNNGYNATKHEIVVGIYEPASRERLPVLDGSGLVTGDTWIIWP